MNNRLEYALAFAKAGFYVHPCSEDKVPLLQGWPEKATTDMAQIEAWDKQHPGCRWGIATGKCGLFVIDVDVLDKKTGARGSDTVTLLEAEHGALPPTFTVRTKSGGKHYWYRGKGKSGARNLGPAVDTRSAGGNLIIPDGVDYVALNDLPIAEAPQWAVELAGKASAKERPEDANVPAPGVTLNTDTNVIRAMDYALHQAPGAPVHQRDVTTWNVACAVRDFGLSFDVALRIVRDFWAQREDVELDSSFNEADVYKKVVSAYNNAKNRLGENLPEAAFSAIPIAAPTELEAFDAGDIDTKLIPKREWLLGAWFLKKFLSVTVAPGGTGKSNLSIIEALALVTGKELSGDYVHERCKVWLHNGEDPKDEIERRIAAACETHRVRPHELKGRLFYTSGREMPLKIAQEVNRQIVINEITLDKIRRFIRDKGIGFWVIDPFVDMHDCDENDNRAINAVAKRLSAIAEETGCSIHVVHHTRKKSKDGALTDMDMARGASALLSAARIGRNLNGMSEKDAESFILPLAASWYVRLDSTKANLASPSDYTQWFEKVSVDLPNGDPVGTLRPVELDRIGTGSKDDVIRSRVIELVEENGGMILINQAARTIESENLVGMKRAGLIRRIRTKTFAHSFSDSDGNVYELTHTRPGEKDGWAVIKKS